MGHAASTTTTATTELEALRREVERLRALESDDSPTLLATLLRHSPHGILVCDATGKLTIHNAAAERIWGGSATTASMKDWSQYRAFHADGAPYGADDWSMVRCLRDREVVAAEEVHIQRFDGTHAMILGSCAPIVGPCGDVRGAVSVFADITTLHELGAAERVLRERTSKLQAVTAALSEARLPHDVASIVALQMAALVGARQAALATVERDELVLLGHSGLGPDTVEAFARFPVRAPLPLAHAFAEAAPVWLESFAEIEQRFPLSARNGPAYVQAIAAVPLVVSGQKLGSIGFGFPAPHAFDAAARALFRDLATQAALALERSRLYEVEQAARRRSDVLARVSRRFAEVGLARDSLVREIANELGAALSTSTALSLCNERGELQLDAVYHPDPDARAMQESLTGTTLAAGFADEVIRSGKTMLLPHIEPRELLERSAPAYRVFAERYPIHAYICAPLRVRGRTIGTVSLGRTRPGETFTEDDRAFVEDIADRAAIAIENARLYEEDVRARMRAEQLYRFAQRAVRANRIEDVYEAALDAIAHAFGTERASILVADKSHVMRFRAWRGISEAYRAAVEGHSLRGRPTRAPPWRWSSPTSPRTRSWRATRRPSRPRTSARSPSSRS